MRKISSDKKGSLSLNLPKADFPIVAIGASAGGLEAVSELLKNLPPDTGMAFLYVQHLSPDHKSMLSSLLAKTTSMKVQEATNKELMLPNNVYVIPPDKEMNIMDGMIKITPRPETPKVNFPIDILFASLAETHNENVIGVILSGSATDGTRGMKAIKREGGLTFAQDDTAKFSSMPKSAIAAGVVDFVLSPQKIAQEISQLSTHSFINPNNDYKGAHSPKLDGETEIDNANLDLKTILHLLHKTQGVDFSQYKMTTIKRRILRRMLLHKIKSLNEYVTLLKEKNDEVNILYQDLLINVTAFFRDTETHQYLKTTLLPRLLKSKKPDEPLRIWVAACATGEEAYSIAITLLEIQSSKFTNIPIQIFATDLDAKAIAKARTGEYSTSELEEVSPKRLQRFYTQTPNGFRVAKSVRDMCVFAQHNVLADPPFARVDFISCCNLLIYLDTAAQKKTIAIFHYALNENGVLMLGKAETVGQSTQLFSPFNKNYKIYTRRNHAGVRPIPGLTSRLAKQTPLEINYNFNERKSQRGNLAANASLDKAIDTVLLSRFIPASVIINEQLDILQFRGTTDLYISPSTGKASLNILKMTRPEIAFELRSAISKAIKSKQSVRKSGIEIKMNEVIRCISVEVVPLKVEWDEPVLLILFTEQQTETIFDSSKDSKSSSVKDRRIKKLEEELAAARADLLILIQEQEAFSQELQTANEEVVSSNEELQAINEELETSKEEIESANEELTTTNQELQTRNELLNESYEYSEALAATIHESMIVLDKNLRVKTANKSFYKAFAVRPEETEGVFLYELGNRQWDIPKLRQQLEEILSKDTHFHDFEVEHEFETIGLKVMLLNAGHITQKAHHEQLILLSILDITEIKKLQQQLQQKEITEEKVKSMHLEATVRKRTKDLIQSNSALEKMNKELEAFTYLSSHDLQEPLRKIQTFTQRILEKENPNLSDIGKDYFYRIQNAAARMRTLIQDLLTFSRISTAEREFELTDLNTIIAEVKYEFKDFIEEKHATIEVGELCELTIIPFQFVQLFQNLISNALKFSAPGIPPHVIIKSEMIKAAHSPLAQKNACHLTIIDNGIGFEQHFSEQIFQVFQKLHGKDEYEGTGIGLAIVKKIVENHSGLITASSELGKGAKFDIYIPV
ncbi:chemotaxis protein CheR [Solitalea longa]|uniref:Chemotaxis protein CheR n=1 Tax=Solitalea longa TaxID=2079460 RepID=A0A2S5A206_9SPHI|nr:chemotaxis protein CheB [Solitalea longa]POY36585.1 chemotaxis protein CheR [Solitalea longa]